jgi:hypothetical protein
VVFQSRPVSPYPVYPAGRVGTPADPNIPRGGEREPTCLEGVERQHHAVQTQRELAPVYEQRPLHVALQEA